MRSYTNIYEIKPKSKNQLLAIIFHLEMLDIDTRCIVPEEWTLLTVRIQMDLIESNVINCSANPVFKSEKSYENLSLEDENIEVISTMERLQEITGLLKR